MSSRFRSALWLASVIVSAVAVVASAPRSGASPIMQIATPVADTYAERYLAGGAGTIIHGAEETLLTGYFDAGPGEELTGLREVQLGAALAGRCDRGGLTANVCSRSERMDS